MKDKVYCENCKFDPGEEERRSLWGVCGWNSAYRDSFLGVEQIEHTLIKNQMNDCAEYKHKWWKFWVKDEE